MTKPIALLLATFAVFASPSRAAAQDFPTRPLTWVVGFAPGGTSDQGARMIAKVMGDKLGQPVIVENRPGAGGIISAEYVAAAKPDGYTLLYAATGVMAANKWLYRKLSYDPLTSFTPIHGLGISPLVLVVPATSPFRSLLDLIDHARRNPDTMTFGSVGIGAMSHLAPELMAKHANIKLVHVPYKGSPPAMTDLLGGRIDMMFDFSIVVKPQIEAGKLRPLAQSGAKRMVSHPDVPTFAELGFPDVQLAGWAVLTGPAGMPQPIVDKLSTAFNDTLKNPSIVKYHEEQGVALMPDTDASKVHAFIASETAKFKDLIERTGSTAQ